MSEHVCIDCKWCGSSSRLMTEIKQKVRLMRGSANPYFCPFANSWVDATQGYCTAMVVDGYREDGYLGRSWKSYDAFEKKVKE